MYTENNSDTNEQCANMLKILRKRGIAAIPLQGKRPHFSIKWKRYQTMLPEIAMLEQWGKQPFNSYGIICGRVSQGIIVIDFDCPKLYTKYASQFTALANTYTVKTKRGYHIYLKTTFPVPSRHFDNCDIKGDGGYVVGAGSIINGQYYTVYKQKPIQTISYKQYTTLLEWFSPKPKQLPLPLTSSSNHVDLVKRYTKLVPEYNRNNALYKVAYEAHQQHISEQQVIKTLAKIHALTPAISTHQIETTAHPMYRLRQSKNSGNR